MAETETDVTSDKLKEIWTKLSPGFESLTADEWDVFSIVMNHAATAEGEVTAFAQGMSLGMETIGGSSSGSGSGGGDVAGLAAAGGHGIFRGCRSHKVDCCPSW